MEWDSLANEKRDEIVQQLIRLEAGYSDPSSDNYNLSVARFLELYGLNQQGIEPGEAIIELIDELTKKGYNVGAMGKGAYQAGLYD